jgi:hypothetical protein
MARLAAFLVMAAVALGAPSSAFAGNHTTTAQASSAVIAQSDTTTTKTTTTVKPEGDTGG